MGPFLRYSAAILLIGGGLLANGLSAVGGPPKKEDPFPLPPIVESRLKEVMTRRGAVDPPKPLTIMDLGPSGRLPRFGYALGVSKDGKSLELLEEEVPVMFAVEEVERQEQTEQDGKTVPVTIREKKRVALPLGYETSAVTYPLDQIRAYDSDGRRVPAAKVQGLFAKERAILFEFEGTRVSPKYLRALSGVPFLVLPVPKPEPIDSKLMLEPLPSDRFPFDLPGKTPQADPGGLKPK